MHHVWHRRDGLSLEGARDRPLAYLRKRLASIYPLYALGLVLSVALRLARGSYLPAWYELGAQALLLQSLLPWLTERTVLTHTWFLSCLVPYWLLFGLLYRPGPHMVHSHTVHLPLL